MANEEPVIISINGNLWIDVTDRTVAGETYSESDVRACGGKRPWIVSTE